MRKQRLDLIHCITKPVSLSNNYTFVVLKYLYPMQEHPMLSRNFKQPTLRNSLTFYTLLFGSHSSQLTTNTQSIAQAPPSLAVLVYSETILT